MQPATGRLVHEGSLDAAILTIGAQTALPHGVENSVIGVSAWVVVLPEGAGDLSARRPLAGRQVLYSTIDLTGPAVHQRLSDLGGHPRPGATIETTLRVARHLRCPALVPDLAARWYAAPGDRIVPSPVPGRITLSLVCRRPAPPALAQTLPRISRRLLGVT